MAPGTALANSSGNGGGFTAEAGTFACVWRPAKARQSTSSAVLGTPPESAWTTCQIWDPYVTFLIGTQVAIRGHQRSEHLLQEASNGPLIECTRGLEDGLWHPLRMDVRQPAPLDEQFERRGGRRRCASARRTVLRLPATTAHQKDLLDGAQLAIELLLF